MFKLSDITNKYPWQSCNQSVQEAWRKAVVENDRQIIVIDDDPTGIQTMSDVPVYTSWYKGILKKIRNNKSKVSFVWTNSRALNADDAEKLYRGIAQDMLCYYNRFKIEFTLITRSDSTLRGNYPEETYAFYDVWQKKLPIDAEIIIPFFLEGNRYTFEDIHYVKQGEELVPCAKTEFAKDKTFGYISSDLKKWIVEKHHDVPEGHIISISLDELRSSHSDCIYKKLIEAQLFDKIIVNAVEINDLKVFVTVLDRAMKSGKRYIFRTAASFVNVISGIMPCEANISFKQNRKGLFIAGSYTDLTNVQIDRLLESGVSGIKVNINDIFNKKTMHRELQRIRKKAVCLLKQDKSICIYSPRQYHTFKSKTNLEIAQAVSEVLTLIAGQLYKFSDYIVAKGGITSHEIAVKGLKIKKAKVLGHAIPGIPVISVKKVFGKLLVYTIFPGNVGDENSLVTIKEKYESEVDCETDK